MRRVWELNNMSEAVRRKVLELAAPDRYPHVVGVGQHLALVYRPDPAWRPLEVAQVALGTLGEEFYDLPVPPWVGVQGDDPWAWPVGKLMFLHEAVEGLRRFVERAQELERALALAMWPASEEVKDDQGDHAEAVERGFGD